MLTGTNSTKRRLTGRRLGIAAVGILVVFARQFFRETYGIGVDSVWWLPSEAQNITYIRNDLIAIAEFNIERDAFERWCASQDMTLRELRDEEPHGVGRCLPFLEQRGVIASVTEPNEAEDDPLRVAQDLGAGDLLYEERWSNGGGYTIGYDTQGQQGYYNFSRH